ncbi:hypothetical protein HYU14_00095 [Candidatus Woesearchaeota archaeon]|nr:hypothetical protein [Candidatus Woesearchaeota archaeon]
MVGNYDRVARGVQALETYVGESAGRIVAGMEDRAINTIEWLMPNLPQTKENRYISRGLQGWRVLLSTLAVRKVLNHFPYGTFANCPDAIEQVLYQETATFINEQLPKFLATVGDNNPLWVVERFSDQWGYSPGVHLAHEVPLPSRPEVILPSLESVPGMSNLKVNLPAFEKFYTGREPLIHANLRPQERFRRGDGESKKNRRQAKKRLHDLERDLR